MHFRTLLAAALAAFLSAPAISAETLTASSEVRQGFTAADIMTRFGLDQVLPQFSQSLAASPRLQGVTDERFLTAWENGALATFDAGALNGRLEAELASGLEATEIDGLGDFLGTPFGQKVLALEVATQSASPERQFGIVARGMVLYLDISPVRRALFEELLSLTSGDVMAAMVGESIRGMALGMHLASPHGDIEVPWQEIDAAVDAQLATLDRDLADSMRAMLAYTYDALTDDEIEAYLQFLREPGTRRFYAVATLAIGNIVRETMFTLGESVAQRLAQVNI